MNEQDFNAATEAAIGFDKYEADHMLWSIFGFLKAYPKEYVDLKEFIVREVNDLNAKKRQRAE